MYVIKYEKPPNATKPLIFRQFSLLRVPLRRVRGNESLVINSNLLLRTP
jgi:hypothetical protein